MFVISLQRSSYQVVTRNYSVYVMYFNLNLVPKCVGGLRWWEV